MMANEWAIFVAPAQTELVFDVDSFVDIHPDYKVKVSSFPIENGAFADYNKVLEPLKAKIKLSVGGKTRSATLLNKLASELSLPNLYNIVTPVRTYLNMTLEGFTYSQTSTNNISMMVATLSFIEIRQVNTGQYTSVKVPSNGKKQETGKGQVNPNPPEAPRTQANLAHNTWAREWKQGKYPGKTLADNPYPFTVN